ncbi:MAG: polysaccharide biosynthesis/export family protein [Myxococcales bacterium]|nr:polysaccharide biosynthesis/export family protein [Myxococcales bacterium]
MNAAPLSRAALVALLAASALSALPAAAQETPTNPTSPAPGAPPPPPATGPDEPTQPSPFGASLFSGSYAGQREDGINPEYRILPGDRVAVNAWGVTTIADIFVVDTQGNIFLPGIGPVPLAGVRNADLTEVVRGAIARSFRGTFGVYTNLLHASPVAVFVTGGVARPGRYAGIPSDSVLFFLHQAGGIDALSGSYRHVRVLRGAQVLADVDLYQFLTEGTLATPQLADGDVILVGRRGPMVEVRPQQGPRVLVELTQADGRGAEVLSVVASGARANEVTVRGMREGRPVVQAFAAPAFAAAPLRDGDVVTFREEGRADHVVVRLEGEYQGPSEVTVRRGTRLLDLLNWVSVDPELANVEAVHVKRASVAAEQRRTILDALDRLERSALLAFSSTEGESTIRVREAELVRTFAERARNVQPLGRVVTSTSGHQLNVLLEEGDTVVIPHRTNVVRIGGEVSFSQAVMYRPDLDIRDYVRMAGGFSNRADTGAVIIIRPSAEVFIGSARGVEIRPGDEIFVPPRIDRKIFQGALDLSRIVYQLAVAASVFIRIGL